jgi:hypothetical protein
LLIYCIRSSNRVQEVGSHEDLMKAEGLYCLLVRKQQTALENPAAVPPALTLSKRQDASMSEPDSVSCPVGDPESACARSSFDEVLGTSAKFRTTLRAVALLRPDWPLVAIACTAGALFGALPPCFSIFIGQVLRHFPESTLSHCLAMQVTSELFYIPGTGEDALHHRTVVLWSCGIAALGLVAAVVQFLTLGITGIVSERLTL